MALNNSEQNGILNPLSSVDTYIDNKNGESDELDDKLFFENPRLQRSSLASLNRHKNNQSVLLVTAILFFVFVVAEIIGALKSNSLSLLGDAGAMSIDVVTYTVNYAAEKIKAKEGMITKKTRLILEIVIPTTSICALLAVTAWITSDAVQVIKDKGDDDDVNVWFLYAFATGNLLVDIISSYLFYKYRKFIFKEKIPTFMSAEGGEERYSIDSSIDEEDKNNAESRASNMNMKAAFTHVSSDTARTMSVFAAAFCATFTNVSGSLCDAWAAIVVTITIVAFVMPLILEIFKKYKKLYPNK